jgi:hypothetical protein
LRSIGSISVQSDFSSPSQLDSVRSQRRKHHAEGEGGGEHAGPSMR